MAHFKDPERPQMTIWHVRISRCGTKSYKYIIRICNTSFFSDLTTVARTRLNATLSVHCLTSFPSSLEAYIASSVSVEWFPAWHTPVY